MQKIERFPQWFIKWFTVQWCVSCPICLSSTENRLKYHLFHKDIIYSPTGLLKTRLWIVRLLSTKTKSKHTIYFNPSTLKPSYGRIISHSEIIRNPMLLLFKQNIFGRTSALSVNFLRFYKILCKLLHWSLIEVK